MENNEIIVNCVDPESFDNSNNVCNVNKPFVNELDNENTGRSLLNEARVEGFKTIEQAEAFLRRENHTLKNPMDERAIMKRVEILREDIEAAQKKQEEEVEAEKKRQEKEKLSTENILKISVPDSKREKLQVVTALIKSGISVYSKAEINGIIITDIKEHFNLSSQEIILMKQSLKEMLDEKKNNDRMEYERKLSCMAKSEQDGEENKPLKIDAEFEGLYTVSINSKTMELIVTPHTDDIANRVIDNKHVIMYNDNTFCYNKGYYKNDIISVKAEAVRILNGICKAERSNGIKRALDDVMTSVKNKNPCYEYPFNKYDNAIPVKNGVVVIDFESGQCTVEDPDPVKWKFNYILPVTFNAEIDNDAIVNELKVYTEDYKMLIQAVAQALLQVMGYGPYKKAYLLKGGKNCGKTTFLDIVEKIIGSMCKGKIPLSELTPQNKFSRAGMEGKLMNIDDDLGYFKMSETGVFKKLTGGYSHRIERKGIDGYDINLTAVNLFTTNTPAGFDSRIYLDNAFWERWGYIEFKHEFAKDDGFKNRILTEDNITGFFNEIVKMVIEIRNNKDLLYVQEWDIVREKWTQESNVLFKFLEENMVLGGKTSVMKEDLLAALTKWGLDKKIDTEIIPIGVNALGEQVVICGGSKDAQRAFLNSDERTNHCFVLNWVWKPVSLYRGYFRVAEGDVSTQYEQNKKGVIATPARSTPKGIMDFAKQADSISA